MTRSKTARLCPPLWLLLAILILIGVIAWLQLTEGRGDEGTNNGFTYAAVLLIATLYLLWFLLLSGQRGWLRLGVLVLVAGLGVAAFQSIHLEGWTGALIPEWRWRWEPAEEESLESAARVAPEAQPVDLVSTTARDFPGFLGATRTAAVEGVQLARDWSARPPELLWRVPTGAAWSGFAVVNGVALTQEQRGEHEVVVARSLQDGSELWRYSHKASFHHFLGGAGPRATPTVDGGLVYSQGSRGHLACLDGTDGSLLWSHELMAEYGMTDELEAQLVAYGRSCSPLVHGELLIIPAGGDPAGAQVGLAAFDKRSGELSWESPARHFSHASPNIAVLAGVEQILVMNEDTATGHDPADGRILWEHPWPGTTATDANNSQVLPLPPDRVLISKGYGLGSSVLRLTPGESGSLQVETLWRSRRALRTKLTNVAVHGDHAYALSDGILECVALADGERIWRDGRYGHGQLLLVGDLLLVLSEEGELRLIEASPDAENKVLGELQVLEGLTWNTFALYGDVVVLRNATEACAWRLPLSRG